MVNRSSRASEVIQWLLLLIIPLGVNFESLVVVMILLLYRWTNVVPAISWSILLLVHAFLSCLLYDYSIFKPLQQIILVALYFIAYSTLFVRCVNDVNDIWEKYLKVCVLFSYIAFIQLLSVVSIGFDPFYFLTETIGDDVSSPMLVFRLHSYFSEPGPFATFLTPYVANGFIDRDFIKNHKLNYFLVFTSFILTFSTIGFFVILLVLFYRLIKSKYRVLLILFPLAFIIYAGDSFIENNTDKDLGSSDAFEATTIKMSETIVAFRDMSPSDFEMLNLSSYATISNLWVAVNAPNRLIGTGIGTHSENYDHIYKSDFPSYGLNKFDAYSIFTRLFSEFGLIGVLGLLFFVVRFFNSDNFLNVSVCFYIIAHLVRGGHYTDNGVFFFLFIYILTSRSFQKGVINEEYNI